MPEITIDELVFIIGILCMFVGTVGWIVYDEFLEHYVDRIKRKRR